MTPTTPSLLLLTEDSQVNHKLTHKPKKISLPLLLKSLRKLSFLHKTLTSTFPTFHNEKKTKKKGTKKKKGYEEDQFYWTQY